MKPQSPDPNQPADKPQPGDTPVSRRSVLAAGTALAAGASALRAQTRISGPAQRTGGRKFRALVQRGASARVEELTMLPIQPTEVVVRTQASAVCYTIVGGVLGGRSFPGAPPSIPNHSGMGVVEEIGSN